MASGMQLREKVELQPDRLKDKFQIAVIGDFSECFKRFFNFKNGFSTI